MTDGEGERGALYARMALGTGCCSQRWHSQRICQGLDLEGLTDPLQLPGLKKGVAPHPAGFDQQGVRRRCERDAPLLGVCRVRISLEGDGERALIQKHPEKGERER
jgi:hypothetical protein